MNQEKNKYVIFVLDLCKTRPVSRSSQKKTFDVKKFNRMIHFTHNQALCIFQIDPIN